MAPEFRAYHLNTTNEANTALQDYLKFLQNSDYPELRPRIALGLYCHLAEASGYWEVVKNMLCIAKGEKYDLQPFRSFVKKYREKGKIIYPNSNKIFQSLIGAAKELKNELLVEVLTNAYSSDLRNAYAHADYVLFAKGVSINNRYGTASTISWEEFDKTIKRGINFYRSFQEVFIEHRKRYSTPKIIKGSLNDEQISNFEIHYLDGVFTIINR